MSRDGVLFSTCDVVRSSISIFLLVNGTRHLLHLKVTRLWVVFLLALLQFHFNFTMYPTPRKKIKLWQSTVIGFHSHHDDLGDRGWWILLLFSISSCHVTVGKIFLEYRNNGGIKFENLSSLSHSSRIRYDTQSFFPIKISH